jgi:preprotein translocase subunit YajC
MLIRPQRKKDKEIKEMRASLKRGDEVITIGGIFGKIIKVNDEIVVLELDHAKQRLKMAKWAIREKALPAEEEPEPKEVEEDTSSEDENKE